MKVRPIWYILAGVAILAVVGFAVSQVLARQQRAEPYDIGEVTQITAVTSVESSGPVLAMQSGSVFWKTTGTVAEVYVSVGDQVKAGDMLMMLDPSSAPQNVILAQADVIAAQRALDELINPPQTAVANARKAVADAQEALDKAKRDLRSVENPAGQSLYDAVSDARLALETAEANLNLSRVGAEATQVKTAENNMNLAYSGLQRAQVEYDDCAKISCSLLAQRETALTNARNNYQSARDAYLTAKLRFDTTVANQADDVPKAQQRYDDAVNNLNAALRGPDALKLAVAQARVAVAEASLADAQDNLDQLLNGADPKDIAAATARLQAARATVDSLVIKAPFEGEVMAIAYQPGDTVSQGQAAVALANSSLLHVDVSVDEADVSRITIGDPALITFSSLPDLTLDGVVAHVTRLGSTVQGLVKYTVRVDFTGMDSRVLLGMTADATIVTDRSEGALAVPLDAVQLDAQGEFVNRITAEGALERVAVKSGEVQADLVVVTGALRPGDKVQVVQPVPTDRGSPFGG